MSDCHKCKYETSAECVPRSQKLGFPKCYQSILTNFDRVHAMNLEEFAQWLCDVAGWLPTFEGRVHPVLEWLKQEADDDGN